MQIFHGSVAQLATHSYLAFLLFCLWCYQRSQGLTSQRPPFPEARGFSAKGNRMHFYPTERIALFIDGANLYATAKALGFDIDYKRLLALFRSKGQLVRALYYTALAEDQEYSSIRPLVDWLDYNGYTMVTKPTKEFTDSFGRRKIKGNMDIELMRRCHAPRRASGSRRAVHR